MTTPTNPQAYKPLNPITGEPLPTHKEVVDAIADYQESLGLSTPISNTEQLDDFIAEIACLYSGFQPNNYWKRAIVEQHPDAHKTARTKLEVLLATHTAEAVATTHSDLTWCLGKLRGLGVPAEHLEKKYGLNTQQGGQDG